MAAPVCVEFGSAIDSWPRAIWSYYTGSYWRALATVPPAYFLQDLFAYVQVLERVGPSLSFWSLCWHCSCFGSFWFDICSSGWSCCAGTQDRVGFEVFCCGWTKMLEQIAGWTQRFVGWSWDFRGTLENSLVQSWFFWLGTHFWVCITFCRVRYNVRLIIIIIISTGVDWSGSNDTQTASPSMLELSKMRWGLTK